MTLAATELLEVIATALANGGSVEDEMGAAEAVYDALFTDANFNNIIRALGGKVAGLDQRMRVEWGSSVLFKQGGDLYE